MKRFEAAQGPRKPCCQSIWGTLAAFFVISSLFSLLSSLFSLLSSPCRRSLATPRSQESSHSLDSISSLFFYSLFSLSYSFFSPPSSFFLQQTLLSDNLGISGFFFSHLFSVLSSRSSGCLSTLESANPYLNTTFSLLSFLFCQVSDRAND